MPATTQEERLLYKIARAYYDDDLTQGEIARRLGLSRVKVCRLLARAREEGVVRISIQAPGAACANLERELERRFGLSEAVLAPADPSQPLEQRLGEAAAEFFARSLRGDEVVGLTWGNTLRAFVAALPRLDLPRLTVVQLIGGLGSVAAGVNGSELTRLLAERCGARPRILQAPGVVASPEVKAALLADREVAETLALGSRADLIVVGVGAPQHTSAALGPGALLSRQELDALVARGAVGDIALRHYDAAGRHLESELDGRVVGVDPAALAAVPRRVAVAGGPAKVAALRAALAGGLVHVLVSDEDTATALLAAATASVHQPHSPPLAKRAAGRKLQPPAAAAGGQTP